MNETIERHDLNTSRMPRYVYNKDDLVAYIILTKFDIYIVVDVMVNQFIGYLSTKSPRVFVIRHFSIN